MLLNDKFTKLPDCQTLSQRWPCLGFLLICFLTQWSLHSNSTINSWIKRKKEKTLFQKKKKKKTQTIKNVFSTNHAHTRLYAMPAKGDTQPRQQTNFWTFWSTLKKWLCLAPWKWHFLLQEFEHLGCCHLYYSVCHKCE